MLKTVSLALVLVLSGGWVAEANDAVGAFLNNGTAQSFADSAWTDARTPVPSTCYDMGGTVRFCGMPATWAVVPPGNGAPMQFQYDAKHFGEMIVEKLGNITAPSLDDFQKVIISNAAKFGRLNVDDIKVLSVTNSQEFGVTARTVVYQLSYRGQPVIFSNTLLITATEAIQLVTYALEDTYTDQQKQLHDAFLEATRIA